MCVIYNLGDKNIKFKSSKEMIICRFFPFYNFRDWSLVLSREIRDSCRDLESVTYHFHPCVSFDVSRSTSRSNSTRRHNSTVEKKWKIPATDSDGMFVSFDSRLLLLIEIVEIRDSKRHIRRFLRWTETRIEKGAQMGNWDCIHHPTVAVSKKSRDDVVPRPYSREDGSRFAD